MKESQFIIETEAALQHLERVLGISITIIDKDGVFALSSGRMLFSHSRVSHQKNRVCRLGFCDRCIQHCRYEMNSEGVKQKRPFIHTCWKGLQEIAIPVFWDDIFLGTVYAGIWRPDQTEKLQVMKVLPKSFHREYQRLPVTGTVDHQSIARMLSIFIQGILVTLDTSTRIQDLSGGRKSQINSFIKYNAVRRVSLKELADSIFLSSSRTSHVVRDLFGKSFQQLVLEERIRRAKAMLTSTELTAGEVAGQVGFHDEYHFNRVFKREVGVPPGKYRKDGK